MSMDSAKASTRRQKFMTHSLHNLLNGFVRPFPLGALAVVMVVPVPVTQNPFAVMFIATT